MSLVEATLFGIDNKVEMALDILRMYEPKDGYDLAFSGGKDSLVIKSLADMAGVKYRPFFNFTTVDPPQLLKYIREYHADVIWVRPEESMWKLIIRKGFPPTRLIRYCCQVLKERYSYGKIIITGVRASESNGRSKYKIVDNCQKTASIHINPILSWSNEEVWEFIGDNGLPYCELYNLGFDRIGCVLCPNGSKRQKLLQTIIFPSFYKAYIRAFDKMLELGRRKGKVFKKNWKTGQEVMDWWLNLEAAEDTEPQLF